jgi:hypothetical protein
MEMHTRRFMGTRPFAKVIASTANQRTSAPIPRGMLREGRPKRRDGVIGPFGSVPRGTAGDGLYDEAVKAPRPNAEGAAAVEKRAIPVDAGRSPLVLAHHPGRLGIRISERSMGGSRYIGKFITARNQEVRSKWSSGD